VNVFRIAGHVPAIVKLSGKADIIVEIAQRVRLAALQIQDAGHLPAFQHLTFGLQRR
jgi:hypothetical protein